MSVQFSSGTVPMRDDTRWVLLVKILMSLRANGSSGGGGGGGGTGTGSVLQGNGSPVAAPADPTSPAVYSDRISGTLWFWNTVTQAWE